MELALPPELIPKIARISGPQASRNLRAGNRPLHHLIAMKDVAWGEAYWRHEKHGLLKLWNWAVRKWYPDVLLAYLPDIPSDRDLATHRNIASALRKAAYKGDLAVTKALLRLNLNLSKSISQQAKLERVDAKEFILGEALYLAAKKNHVEVAEMLIAAGADDDYIGYPVFGEPFIEGENENEFGSISDYIAHKPKSSTHRAPTLVVAASASHFEIIKAILVRNRQSHKTTANGVLNKAMLESVRKGAGTEIIQLFLENGANIHLRSHDPLVVASETNNAPLVQLFVILGADVQCRDEARWCSSRDDDNLPLMVAAHGGYIDVVVILLRNSADIHANDGLALSLAAQHDNVELMKLLLSSGANVQAHGVGALVQAAYHGHAKVAKLLIESGCTVNIPSEGSSRFNEHPDHNNLGGLGKDLCANRKNLPVVVYAAGRGYVEVMKVLIEAGADINAASGIALRAAARGGHIGVVEMLVQAGADVHVGWDESLLMAARNGHVSVVQKLLQAGADVNAQEGQIVIAAARAGNASVLSVLLEVGGDVHTLDGWPLRVAAKEGHVDTVNLLIKWGADVGSAGVQAVQMAAMGGFEAVVEIILEHMDARSLACRTLFAPPAYHGHTPVVKLLLAKGVTAYDAPLALFYAAQKGHFEMTRLFLEHGRGVNWLEAWKEAKARGWKEVADLLWKWGASAISDAEISRERSGWNLPDPISKDLVLPSPSMLDWRVVLCSTRSAALPPVDKHRETSATSRSSIIPLYVQGTFPPSRPPNGTFPPASIRAPGPLTNPPLPNGNIQPVPLPLLSMTPCEDNTASQYPTSLASGSHVVSSLPSLPHRPPGIDTGAPYVTASSMMPPHGYDVSPPPPPPDVSPHDSDADAAEKSIAVGETGALRGADVQKVVAGKEDSDGDGKW
ncbi:hypothetical protein HDV00_003514 [Rhizophlyctis rosea]|nr:hypothetical protein HDV00_003514 [Rhizophlyctis rosea]